MKQKTVTPFTAKYIEFPELVFGKSSNGIEYFDATLYVELKGDSQKHSPIDFARRFSFWFENFLKVYDIADNQMIITDETTGHVLIDETMALLFLAYIDPSFGAYMMDRISEMLLNGIVLSDTRIVQAAGDRLTKEVLIKLIE